MSVTAVLSLGSNLGDRRGHLRAGLEIIAAAVPVTGVSPLYETAAVGVVDQPAFLNCVALVTVADAEEAFAAAGRAEAARGRLRSTRWGPRSLDVDVVTVDALRQADPRLTLPHPRAHERAFVLRPWLDIAPDAELPGRGPVWRIVRALPAQDVAVVDW